MKIISFIICLMFCLLLLFTGMSIAGVTVSGGIAGGEIDAEELPVGDGWIGFYGTSYEGTTRTDNGGTGGKIGISISPTNTGAINYAHINIYQAIGEGETAQVALYDSDGDLVCYSNFVNPSAGTSTWVSQALDKQYVLTNQEYIIVIHSSTTCYWNVGSSSGKRSEYASFSSTPSSTFSLSETTMYMGRAHFSNSPTAGAAS